MDPLPYLLSYRLKFCKLNKAIELELFSLYSFSVLGYHKPINHHSIGTGLALLLLLFFEK